MESKFPVQSHGPDKLLWEQVKNQLPESFYEKGVEFLLSVDPLFAGRMSLARQDVFGEKGKSIASKKKSKKMEQYEFLLDKNPKSKPSSTNEDLPLAAELFERYRYLLAMRKEPYIQNVLGQVPEKCDEEVKKCLKTKMAISAFLNPKLEAKKEELLKSIENNPEVTKKLVETIYETEVRQL
jgi:hypothetical protein